MSDHDAVDPVVSSPAVDCPDVSSSPVAARGILLRAVAGGALMGLANLVPGISGGTMLVATGVYTQFIEAVSRASRLRLTRSVVLLLVAIVGGALFSIGAFAGLISVALAGFRWGMYSLFIGLTLGGVPIMLRLLGRRSAGAIAGVAAGVAVMIGLVVLQSSQPGGGGGGSANPILLGLAGMAGASAMILPGVSGAYLLLILGQYENIVSVIKDTVRAASQGDIGGVMSGAGTLIPVGIGVVVGVVVVGNLLRFVLHRYEKLTLGFLLGLLIAAPAGLYPFKRGVAPEVGETVGGEVVTAETVGEIDPKDWPEVFFTPGAAHIAGSLALIAVGVAGTMGVARLGKETSSA